MYAGRTIMVIDTLFSNNTATNGSGVYVYGGAAGNSRVVNGLFAGNGATPNGAALYLGATLSTGRTATILHTTVASLTLGAAQAIYVGGSGVTTGITNTIVASYNIGMDQVAGTVTSWNTLFHGNTADTSGTVTNNAPVAGTRSLWSRPTATTMSAPTRLPWMPAWLRASPPTLTGTLGRRGWAMTSVTTKCCSGAHLI